MSIATGFSSILLILFLAWLLSFLVDQAADGVGRRVHLGRKKAIAVVYVAVVAFVGLFVFATVQVGARDAADILARTDEVTARIRGILVGIQSSLGIGTGTINLVETFDDGQRALFATISGSLNREVQAIAGTTLTVLGTTFVIVILSLYAVLDADAIHGALARVIPNRFAGELTMVERSVGRAFGGFLGTQVVLVTAQVALTIVVGLAFGLP